MGCKQELFGITKVPKPCQSMQIVEEGVFLPIYKIILLQPDLNMVPIKYKANAFFSDPAWRYKKKRL